MCTMIAALPLFDIFTGKQAGNIFCLNNQPNIACFMMIRGVYHLIFQSFAYISAVIISILGDMIERLDVTHLL